MSSRGRSLSWTAIRGVKAEKGLPASRGMNLCRGNVGNGVFEGDYGCYAVWFDDSVPCRLPMPGVVGWSHLPLLCPVPCLGPSCALRRCLVWLGWYGVAFLHRWLQLYRLAVYRPRRRVLFASTPEALQLSHQGCGHGTWWWVEVENRLLMYIRVPWFRHVVLAGRLVTSLLSMLDMCQVLIVERFLYYRYCEGIGDERGVFSHGRRPVENNAVHGVG